MIHHFTRLLNGMSILLIFVGCAILLGIVTKLSKEYGWIAPTIVLFLAVSYLIGLFTERG